jgi:hypothetical protein
MVAKTFLFDKCCQAAGTDNLMLGLNALTF